MINYIINLVKNKFNKKEDIYEVDIRDIFDSHPRDEWISLLNSIAKYKETKYGTEILNVKPYGIEKLKWYQKHEDCILAYTIEELQIKKYPIDIGDIVTHKDLGGKFVVYDLPILDERRLIKDIPSLSQKIEIDPPFYFVIGIIDKDYAGTYLDWYKGIDSIYITEREAYWKKWEKIGSVFDLDNSNILCELFLSYWFNCPEDFEPLYSKIHKKWSKQELEYMEKEDKYWEEYYKKKRGL